MGAGTKDAACEFLCPDLSNIVFMLYTRFTVTGFNFNYLARGTIPILMMSKVFPVERETKLANSIHCWQSLQKRDRWGISLCLKQERQTHAHFKEGRATHN